MRRALRYAGGGAASATLLAGAQGLYLQSLYKPLPEARGPSSGLFVHKLLARIPRLPGAEGGASAAPGKRKLLFVGDSLITGVGCSPDGSAGPALPRSVAEFVCRHLGQDVEWTALGYTGGNVREISHSLLPRVDVEVARARAAGESFDAVVVVVGLNDFKKAYRGAQFTACSFRTELGELVLTIQRAAGTQCTVVLPALPVHRAPVFGGMWPLQQLIPQLAGLWDEQKRSLAQCLRRVRFVTNAEGTEWWCAPRYWAADGIHPNDEGYRIWGEHIAHTVSQALRGPAPPAVQSVRTEVQP